MTSIYLECSFCDYHETSELDDNDIEAKETMFYSHLEHHLADIALACLPQISTWPVPNPEEVAEGGEEIESVV